MFYKIIRYSFLLSSLMLTSVFVYAGLEDSTGAAAQAASSSSWPCKKKVFFTTEEDAILMEVAVNNPPKTRDGRILWSSLEQRYNQRIRVSGLEVPERNAKQLRERYANYLQVTFNQDSLSEEEHELLSTLIKDHYLKFGVEYCFPWSTWARTSFSKRSPQFLKNIYATSEFQQRLCRMFVKLRDESSNNQLYAKYEIILKEVRRVSLLKIFRTQNRPLRPRSAPKRVAQEVMAASDAQQLVVQPLLLISQMPQGIESPKVAPQNPDVPDAAAGLPELYALLSSDAGFQRHSQEGQPEQAYALPHCSLDHDALFSPFVPVNLGLTENDLYAFQE